MFGNPCPGHCRWWRELRLQLICGWHVIGRTSSLILKKYHSWQLICQFLKFFFVLKRYVLTEKKKSFSNPTHLRHRHLLYHQLFKFSLSHLLAIEHNCVRSDTWLLSTKNHFFLGNYTLWQHQMGIGGKVHFSAKNATHINYISSWAFYRWEGWHSQRTCSVWQMVGART